MALVTGDPFSPTELQYRIPEVWSPALLEELFEKTVAANWFRDYSNEVAQEGDTINIADIYTNSFTAETQSTQGTEVSTEAIAQAQVQLTIDTHKYIAFLIGDKDSKQLLSSFDFNAVYARKAAGTLRDGFEDALFALWSGLSQTSGDTATVLTDLELRTAIATLDSANHELEDIAWFFHPNVYWKQVAGIQKLYDASMRGAGKSVTITGNFSEMSGKRNNKGVIYDFPIFTSSNVVSGLETYRNLLAHKDAFGFANQTPTMSGGNGVRVQSEYQLRNLGTLTVCDIIYGTTEVRDDAAVVVNANNSATTA